MQYPNTLRYTKEHEWAKSEGKTITVGITDHAQKSLGDIVYVELPKIGRVLKKAETFGVVESIKAVSDLYSPIEGKVVEINAALTDNPAQINKDPHNAAWLVKLEVADPKSLDGLMDASAYSKFVESLK